MIERKAIIGVCVLCALAVGAVAAPGASALGTTSVTCVAVASEAEFFDNHCKEPKPVKGGEGFSHKSVTTNTELELKGELTKLTSTISGVEVELQSTSLTGTGTTSNSLSGSEMVSSGTGTLTYKGVTVTKPAGKGCKVKTGEVVTKKLKSTTAGQEMFVKFEPNEGAVFAEFTVEGCSIAALNGLYKVEGSVKCPPTGATIVCTHAATTALGTLKLRGQVAGIDGSVTTAAKGPGDPGFTALAKTTL